MSESGVNGSDLVDGVCRRVAAVGAGWEIRDGEFWCAVTPDPGKLREQGWKLHMSATPRSAPTVLNKTSSTSPRRHHEPARSRYPRRRPEHPRTAAGRPTRTRTSRPAHPRRTTTHHPRPRLRQPRPHRHSGRSHQPPSTPTPRHASNTRSTTAAAPSSSSPTESAQRYAPTRSSSSTAPTPPSAHTTTCSPAPCYTADWSATGTPDPTPPHPETFDARTSTDRADTAADGYRDRTYPRADPPDRSDRVPEAPRHETGPGRHWMALLIIAPLRPGSCCPTCFTCRAG